MKSKIEQDIYWQQGKRYALRQKGKIIDNPTIKHSFDTLILPQMYTTLK